jgi:uncharacterized membrane protein YsdA (DUF1294 family)
MRFNRKLTKWHEDKAFGFIAPQRCCQPGFIHQSAFANKARIPKISDIIPISLIRGFTLYAVKMTKYKVFILITSCSNYLVILTSKNNQIISEIGIITFSITKDKAGRYCACDAIFFGERLKIKQPKKINQCSIYLSLIFLAAIMITFTLGYFPQKLMSIYIGLSFLTFLSYAIDKPKVKRGAWLTQESTLHMLALIGGGRCSAREKNFRHKSSKRAFKPVFWSTIMINLALLLWLYSSSGVQYLQLVT